MYYVYLIRSQLNSHKTYIGCTNNIKQRLQKHNEGASIYTKNYRPWELVVVLSFKSKSRALEFEKYLKSGSGNAFAKKRLW